MSRPSKACPVTMTGRFSDGRIHSTSAHARSDVLFQLVPIPSHHIRPSDVRALQFRPIDISSFPNRLSRICSSSCSASDHRARLMSIRSTSRSHSNLPSDHLTVRRPNRDDDDDNGDPNSATDAEQVREEGHNEIVRSDETRTEPPSTVGYPLTQIETDRHP